MLRSVAGVGRAVRCGVRRRRQVGPVETLESRVLLSSGDLDPTFGVGGKVTTDFPGSAGDRLIRDVGIQSDGKMVEAAFHGGFGTSEPVMAVTRFNTDGSIDTTFGDNGLRIIDYPDRGEVFPSLAVGPDDRIVVGTWSVSPTTDLLANDSDVLVAVLTPDGALDTSFDGDGMKNFDYAQVTGGASAAKTNEIVFDLAVQPDGKIVTAGGVTVDGAGRIALARLNPDGSFDTTFDGDGVAAPAFTGYNAYANSVAIDAAGKIVVTGPAFIPPPKRTDPINNEFVVARYNPDGSLDTTFDGDGWTITSFGPNDDTPSQLRMAPGGKIVVGGGTQTGTTSVQDIALVRYNPNGSLDTTFSGDGKATVALTNSTTGAATNETVGGMAIQDDGSILISGVSTQGLGTSADRFLVRVTPDSGVLDPSFGTGGKVLVPDMDSLLAIAIQPADGSIFVGGHDTRPQGGFEDFALARFDSSGNIDASFGQNGTGVATADFDGNGFNSVTGAALQSDGKLVLGGFTIVNNGNLRDLLFARYNADGSLDDTFGQGGLVRIDLMPFVGSDVRERVATITLDADGKIVFAGDITDPTTKTTDMLVGRLNPDGSLDPDFAFGAGIVSIGSFAGNPNANELVNDVLVQPDGRIVVVGEYSTSSSAREFAALRLEASGDFDASFGPDGSGAVHVAVGGPDSSANAVTLVPDQFGAGWDLVLAGRSRINSADQFALLRLNGDGSRDLGFGNVGTVTTTFTGTSSAAANDVVIDAQGRIVAAGSARMTSGDDFALARYTPGGVLDNTFDADGRVTTDFDGSSDVINSLVTLPNGGYLAGGYEALANSNFALAKYNADGSLDTNFATAGRARTDFAIGNYSTAPVVSRDQGVELFLYPGDRAVLAGNAILPRTGSDFAAARYLLTGAPNSPPVAQITGGPFTMDEGGTIQLSAAGSTDADGQIVNYEWDTNYQASFGFSADAYGVQVPFSQADEGLTRVALRVTDEDGASQLVQTTVSVNNVAPAVNAGPDATIAPGAAFTAVGSFTDPGISDTFTATVDYGDGTGTSALTLTGKTFTLNHTYATNGAYNVVVTVRDNDGGVGTDSVIVAAGTTVNHVEGRQVYYHNSKFETNAGGSPEAAVPPVKQPLLPGQTAVGVNITDYTRGINGIIVTLDGAAGGPITAADFRFKVGRAGSTAVWPDAPAPAAVNAVAGTDGKTRVYVTWADGQIKNTWLQVTVLNTANTKLGAPDVFYYGNVVGNSMSPPNRIDGSDYLRTRAAMSRLPVPVGNQYDHDHNGRVDALDVAATRANLFQSIDLITAPAASGAASVSAVRAASLASVMPATVAPSAPTRDRATELLTEPQEP